MTWLFTGRSLITLGRYMKVAKSGVLAPITGHKAKKIFSLSRYSTSYSAYEVVMWAVLGLVLLNKGLSGLEFGTLPLLVDALPRVVAVGYGVDVLGVDRALRARHFHPRPRKVCCIWLWLSSYGRSRVFPVDGPGYLLWVGAVYDGDGYPGLL